MSLNQRLAVGIAMNLLLPAAVPAQPGGGGSPRADVTQRFERAAPRVGEPMPELTVHDAEGGDVQLRDLLEGHYTVLVLGCLT